MEESGIKADGVNGALAAREIPRELRALEPPEPTPRVIELHVHHLVVGAWTRQAS